MNIQPTSCLRAMPQTYTAPCVTTAKRGFPQRGYMKVTRLGIDEPKLRLELEKWRESSNKQAAPISSPVKVTKQVIRRAPIYPPAVRRQKMTQEFRRQKSGTLPAVQQPPPRQRNMTTESWETLLQTPKTLKMLEREQMVTAMLDHPIHRMLMERLDKIYDEDQAIKSNLPIRRRRLPHKF